MVPEDPAPDVRLTAESVKVLAHPLRTRLLTALRRAGPATATMLAAELDTNTGATSYHLRRLAEVGLVIDTGEGVGRRRLWRAASGSHGWERRDFVDDPDAVAALDWMARNHHREFDEQYSAWLDRLDGWPPDWQDVAGMTNEWVLLTPEQLGALARELEDLLDRYRETGQPDMARARRVSVWAFAFPLPGEAAPETDR